jgi:YidC/Oxa1 family membrane protein insertase
MLSLIGTIFDTIIFEPLLNLLVVVLNALPGHSFGLAIIIVTILTRVLLYPLSHKGAVSQKKMMALQPELQKIKEKHKKDRQAQAKAQMELYRSHNVSMFGGINMLLLQFPILIGLYRVFLMEFTPENFEHLYSFVAKPEVVNTVFLGVVDLTIPSISLGILAGLAQFLYSDKIQKKRRTGLSTHYGNTDNVHIPRPHCFY